MSGNHSGADALGALSAALADRVAAATPMVAAVHAGGRRGLSAIIWGDGVVVTSEQALPEQDAYEVALPGGRAVAAQLAGRDAGTNLAVLRADGATGAVPAAAAAARVGALAVALGATRDGVAARLAMVAQVGGAWTSMAGGHIDALLHLDGRAGHGLEGGPVIDAAGGLLGMAAAGPRGRVLVIPHATVARGVGPLLAGRPPGRGWLGVGLQPVALPESLREAAGQGAGLMVVSLAGGGPAEQGGVLPGDILLTIAGRSVAHPQALRAALAPDLIGQAIEVRLMRGGAVRAVSPIVAARPTE